MAPKKLHHNLNEYFEELFAPVKAHNGLIIDVVGDAMLGAWLKDDAIILRESACQAAIEIQKRLKQQEDTFPTRIGLHCGEISVGNVGAGDHFEYRIVGDVVNTATRIEGLNKYLKTGILASEQTLLGLEKLPSRKLGQFRLKGKQQALTIYELFTEPPPDNLCQCFAKALRSFSEHQWHVAIQLFNACLKQYPEDGPSQFYLSLAEQFIHSPPDDDWDDVVNISQK